MRLGAYRRSSKSLWIYLSRLTPARNPVPLLVKTPSSILVLLFSGGSSVTTLVDRTSSAALGIMSCADDSPFWSAHRTGFGVVAF